MDWKSYDFNQPDFPQIRHYNVLLIDYVNEIYEYIFGFSTYVNWELYTKYMVETSPYGIVTLDKEGPEFRPVEPFKGLTKYLHYLEL